MGDEPEAPSIWVPKRATVETECVSQEAGIPSLYGEDTPLIPPAVER